MNLDTTTSKTTTTQLQANEEVKDVGFLYGGFNIFFLQRSSLGLFGSTPCSNGQLQDEHFTSFGK